jgi:G3E family GTPase
VGPVVQTFFAQPSVQRTLRLDAVLCVCDARALALTAAGGAPQAG